VKNSSRADFYPRLYPTRIFSAIDFFHFQAFIPIQPFCSHFVQCLSADILDLSLVVISRQFKQLYTRKKRGS